MAWPVGRKHTPQKVKCVGCGVSLMRCSHTLQAKCEKCQEECRKGRQQDRWRRLHTEARWCRIILHRTGYPATSEGVKELLRDLKDHPLEYRRQPEGAAACINMAYERKSRAAERRRHVS